tara:strand:+ start:1079 stop:1570 length:492 start_codon:yes stop_codon:yes gene_type:complete
MNPEERLNLQKMIAANDVVDQTSKIRELKHADLIWEDVKLMTLLKNKYARMKGSESYKNIICKNCNFLFNNYTDIYNKLLKDELDVNILYTFITELKKIELGQVDQHEASFKIGSLLKKMYVDAALKKADSLDKNGKPKVFKKSKKITWEQYKSMNNTQITTE